MSTTTWGLSMQYQAIGKILSEFPEKFGVPKQPGLAPSLRAILRLEGPWGHETLARGLEDCSHLWVLFDFHLSGPFRGGTVRPPILGGEKRMGVFATRSPHRPNSIGLSLVKREKIEFKDGAINIHVSGHDFVNETPILDIKPYVASYDRPSGEVSHWSDKILTKALAVVWSPSSELQLRQLASEHLRDPIEQVLALDPRPRQANPESVFGLSFCDLNITFSSQGEGLCVQAVEKAGSLHRVK